MTATHTIVQELIYFSSVDGELQARVEHVPLPATVAPDQHAREHLNWASGTEPGGALLHSTSWRAVPEDAALILTWAVLPDPDPTNATPVGEPVIAQGADGAHPVPEDLQLHHVIAHAARHLAFLSHTDPGVRAAIHAHPDMHDALVRFAPDVAVNATHDSE